MYTEDELPEIDHEGVVAGKIKNNANKEIIDIKADDIIDISEQTKAEPIRNVEPVQQTIDAEPY
jgi:hypothetical protein